jgi:hypothetical protein
MSDARGSRVASEGTRSFQRDHTLQPAGAVNHWQGVRDPYPRGEPLSLLRDDGWIFPAGAGNESTIDLYFKTYVVPTPEPASLVLMGGGLLLISARARRAKRAGRGPV